MTSTSIGRCALASAYMDEKTVIRGRVSSFRSDCDHTSKLTATIAKIRSFEERAQVALVNLVAQSASDGRHLVFQRLCSCFSSGRRLEEFLGGQNRQDRSSTLGEPEKGGVYLGVAER